MRTSATVIALAGMITCFLASTPDAGLAQTGPQLIDPLPTSIHTGNKPQSKLWQHEDRWYAALPDSHGTWVWQLRGTAWERGMRLDGRSTSRADVVAVEGTAHALLLQGSLATLVSAEYDASRGGYRPWPERPTASLLQLHAEVETATIALDGGGRMWLAADTDTLIQVHWSDPPYGAWHGPATIASGVHKDDISLIAAMRDGGVGVLWSNQNAQRFGFRTHRPGAPPADWSADEVPAGESALEMHLGMADDHLNAAVATDGTLFFAVKTSYDTKGYPLVALLVRRPGGQWDELHNVDDAGTRGVALLDEASGTVCVVYTSHRDNQIVYRTSPMDEIRFGPRQVLIGRQGVNNATTSKANAEGRALIVASARRSKEQRAPLDALGVLFDVGAGRE